MHADSLPPLAAHLRAATRQAHHALDHHPLLAPLVHPELSTDSYARALAGLFATQNVMESLLADFAPPTTLPPRLPDLAADLAELGRTPYPLAAVLPEPTSDADRIGYLYVVEGSNLGGAVIARCLARHLPAELPQRFFAHSGGMPRWQHFWDFVAGQGAATDFTAAAGAACRALDFYRHHLDRCLSAG